jgi:hypothetical protein
MSFTCQFHAIIRTSEEIPQPIIRLRDPEVIPEKCEDCPAVQEGLAAAISDLNTAGLDGALWAVCETCGSKFGRRTVTLRNAVTRTNDQTGVVEYFTDIP